MKLLRAEFTKFRTVRAWVIALCATAVVFVLLSFLSAFASRQGNPTEPATGPGGEAVSDTYMFVHRVMVGDGSLTTRVVSLSGEHTSFSSSSNAFSESSKGGPSSQLHPGLAPWAKAGIILEPGTNQGTDYAAVMVTGSHGVQMQDNYTHDSAGLAGPVGPSSPRWLRLTRAGDVITSYDSADGTHWTEIGTARLADLPRPVQIGLFVTSPLYFAAGADIGSPSVATATFDHTSADGDVPSRSWTGGLVAGLYPYQSSASAWQQRSADSFTISGSGDIAPLVGDIISAAWSGASIVNGTILALLIVIVLATFFATSEYRRGLIRTTSRRQPAPWSRPGRQGRRRRIPGLRRRSHRNRDRRTDHPPRPGCQRELPLPAKRADLARVIIGTGLFLGLAAALAVALGRMLRRSVLAVAAGFVLLVLPGILGSQSGNWLMRLTPTAAFAIQATLPRSSLVTSAYTPPNGYFPISSWGGLAVLAAYTAVALIAALWLLRRRDA